MISDWTTIKPDLDLVTRLHVLANLTESRPAHITCAAPLDYEVSVIHAF